MLTYLRNLLKLARDDRRLVPQAVIFHVSGQCNFNCAYCEDYGARRNSQTDAPISLDDALHVLRVIRTGADSLILTGGEPLLHPQIDEIVRAAKNDFRFRQLTLITNGLLLPNHETLLPALDRLIVSLDSIDMQMWSAIINMPAATAQSILDNIVRYAAIQKKHGYTMIVNAVLNPQTIPGALVLLDFCERNHLLVSFSPQAVLNLPQYDLLVSEEYQRLLDALIERKKRGAPILGSCAYLQTLRDMNPYDCYPLLVPRVMPDGGLVYPCRPLEKAHDGQGGRDANLLQVEHWDEADDKSFEMYGKPPRVCTSCFQQCYAEPSLMQARPLTFLWENLRYPASRKGNLTTYAPG